MEEDTKAKAAKEAVGKQTSARTNDMRPALRSTGSAWQSETGSRPISLLKRKTAILAAVADGPTNCVDLCITIDKSKVRKIEGTSLKSRVADVRDQLNSKSGDLNIKLSRSKNFDLRRRLEAMEQYPLMDSGVTNTVGDLRARLESTKAARIPHLNVIMGGSPPCGDSVRAVKNYHGQATTSQKWPLQIEDDRQITFSAIDTCGLHMPHNDPLLIDIGIGECQVTKVLVDIGSSVDLIFCHTLDKMGIDSRDMKPSSRTLTGFNAASEQMIDTICLPVYASDVTRTVKFSVIRAKAPYNAILST
ncbi:hypothetical protein N665_0067s0040 [Sinapis alba]|nr:hypothetical protein N665_0067s0040 [Sinapis alba]